MKQVENKKHIVSVKIIYFALSFLMILSIFMASSYAWRGLVNKENLFSGTQQEKKSDPTKPGTKDPTSNTDKKDDTSFSSNTIKIEGMKKWEHGKNPAVNQPKNITVLVKNGNAVVIQKIVSAADGWQWNFSLPKYDSYNKEIVYTVDEDTVYGYRKKVDGYSITNTYIPPALNIPDSPDPGLSNPSRRNKPSSDSPNTGDTTNMAIWFVIMIGCAFCLRLLLEKRR